MISGKNICPEFLFFLILFCFPFSPTDATPVKNIHLSQTVRQAKKQNKLLKKIERKQKRIAKNKKRRFGKTLLRIFLVIGLTLLIIALFILILAAFGVGRDFDKGDIYRVGLIFLIPAAIIALAILIFTEKCVKKKKALKNKETDKGSN